MRNLFKDKDLMRQVFIFAAAGIIVVSFYLVISNLDIVGGVIGEVVDVLMPFIWGIIFYLLLGKVEKFIEERIPAKLSLKWRRIIATFASIIFLLLFIGLFFLIIVPSLIDSGTRLAININTYIGDLMNWLESLDLQYLINDKTIQTLETYMTDVFSELINFLRASIPSIVSTTYATISGIFSFIIGLIICAYIMIDRDRLHHQFIKLGKAFLKDGHLINITRVFSKAVEKFNSFIRGQLIDALIVGILCFILMTILHLDYAVLISCICALTNVIPVFGPFIGAIPSAFLLLMVDPIQCLVFVIMIVVLQQVDGNIICPKILGDSIGLSKVWIMFAIIVGGGLFGIVGMFFGVPIFGLFYYFLNEYAQSRIDNKKESTGDSE